MSNPEILKYFELQRLNPDSSLSFINLLELAVKGQSFSEDKHIQIREKILVLKLLTSSVHQFFLEIDGVQIFDFGIEIKKKSELISYYENHIKSFKQKAKPGEIEIRRIHDFLSKEVSFHAYSLSYFEENRSAFLLFVFPSKVQNANSIIKDIMEIVRNTFLFSPKQNKNNYYPIYSDFKKHLTSTIKAYPYRNNTIRGVFALFLIEDLGLYSKYMGEQFTAHIIREIMNTIHKYLKKNDILYNINRRTFITYLPDCDVDVVEKRFEDVFFRIDPLLIKYDLFFFPVDLISIQSEDFLDKIISQEFNSIP